MNQVPPTAVDIRPQTGAAFEAATKLFVDTVDDIPAASWDEVALGQWTTRQLVAHTLRALTTIEQYLQTPGQRPDDATELGDAEQYFREVLNGGAAVHDAVLARGVAAGAELVDPSSTIHQTADRVSALVRATPNDTVVTTPAGTMQLIDYLPTRIVELVVHSLDLGTRRPVETGAAQLVCSILAGIEPGDTLRIIRAITGRTELPAGFNVLGPNPPSTSRDG